MSDISRLHNLLLCKQLNTCLEDVLATTLLACNLSQNPRLSLLVDLQWVNDLISETRSWLPRSAPKVSWFLYMLWRSSQNVSSIHLRVWSAKFPVQTATPALSIYRITVWAEFYDDGSGAAVDRGHYVLVITKSEFVGLSYVDELGKLLLSPLISNALKRQLFGQIAII